MNYNKESNFLFKKYFSLRSILKDRKYAIYDEAINITIIGFLNFKRNVQKFSKIKNLICEIIL